MAKAKALSNSHEDQLVNVNGNLLDANGDGHPYAGQQVRIIQRTAKNTYQVAPKEGLPFLLHGGDWNTFDPTGHSADMAEQRDTINLYTDAKRNQVEQLLPGTIHESPFNPRTNYPADEMDELAQSAREVGILQPVLVRPRGDGSYELVFGHRRHRAALQAGLTIIPAIVRELTDAQSAQLQAVENVQRRDLDPIDEALGYAAFIAAHGISKDELALQIGKSRTHVYNRLKLATLHPAGQAALRAGKLKAEVATHLARVVGEKNQAKALALMLESGYGGELKSLRTARSELSEKFTLDLKTALWAVDDAGLVAGAGACTDCPKRSGFDPIVYADLLVKPDYYSSSPKGKDVCTDPDCFAAKKTAHLKRQQEALEAKGKLVVTGNAARKAIDAQGNIKGDYIPVSEMRDALKSANKGMAGPVVTTMTIQDPRSGKTVEVVKRKEAEAAGVKTPAAKPSSSQQAWQMRQKEDAADHQKRESEAQKKTAQNMAILHKVRSLAPGGKSGTLEMQLIAKAALAGVAYRDMATLCTLYPVTDGHDQATDQIKAICQQISSMNAVQLQQLMLDCALVHGIRSNAYHPQAEPEELLALAEDYGIDVEAVRQACAAETPGAAHANAGAEVTA